MTFLVMGRSLKNYRAKGHAVPPDVVHLNCHFCDTAITITEKGAMRIGEAIARGDNGFAICTSCTLLASQRPAGLQELMKRLKP